MFETVSTSVRSAKCEVRSKCEVARSTCEAPAFSSSRVFQHQQRYGDRGQRNEPAVELAGAAGGDVQRDVQDESPENTLRNRKRQRNQNECRKCRNADRSLIEGHARDGLKHRHADDDQHGGGGVRRHGGRERCDEQARQKAQRRDDRGPSRAAAHADAGDALDVGGAGRGAEEAGAERRERIHDEAAAQIARPAIGSTRPAACDTPMNVDSESKRSVIVIVAIAGSSASRRAPRISSLKNTDEKSGALTQLAAA